MKVKKIKFSRRGFLGSLLGSFAVAQLPWIAREPFADPIIQPETILSGYTSYQRLLDGTIIQGPEVKNIIDGGIILHDIWINERLEVTGSIIYYKGKLLSDANFPAYQTVYCGDTLKITHNLSVSIGNKIIRPNNQEEIDKYIFAKELFNENNLH